MKYLFLLVALSIACASISNLTLADVQTRFQGLPITHVEIQNSLNNQNIGRPDGPVEGMVFDDTRQQKDEVTKYFYSGNIAVYESSAIAKKRFEFQDGMNRALPNSDYIYLHKNVIVVIDHSLKPEQAEEYKKALESL